MSMMLRRYHEQVETVEEAAEVEPQPVPGEPPVPTEEPAGNASKAEWHAYALSQGYTEEGLEGRTRDELRALFDND